MSRFYKIDIFIQVSITNSLVIFNAAKNGKEKAGIKEFIISIAKYCIQKGQQKRQKPHENVVLIH